MTITTIIRNLSALALAALVVTVASPAHAAADSTSRAKGTSSGVSLNGVSLNGVSLNGVSLNGVSLN